MADTIKLTHTAAEIDAAVANAKGGVVKTINGKNGDVALSVPTKTSDLTNDNGFITKAASDLVNYYKKSETYTQTEINQKISAIPKFSIEVVAALPSSDISTTTVYLVSGGNGSDLYTEYIYVNGTWEVLGSQKVDLTGYAKEAWVIGKIAEYKPAFYIDLMYVNTVDGIDVYTHGGAEAYAAMMTAYEAGQPVFARHFSEAGNEHPMIAPLASINAEGWVFGLTDGANAYVTQVTASDAMQLAIPLVTPDQIPETLPNPNALTFTGAATGTYDGSAAKTVNIPASPTKLSELTADATHRLVTDTEKAAWNAKSNFSGAYADLTGKPTIPTVPTKVSAFTNDKGYITGITGTDVTTALGYTPANQTDIDTIEQEILITPGTMAEQAVDVYNDTSHTWEDGLYVNFGNGSTSSSASYYGCADYFEIPEGGRLFANYTNTALYYPTVAFYDANKTYISGEYPRLSSVDERNEYNGLYGYFYQVPANARYFRFSVQTGMKGILKMYLIFDVVVGGKVKIPNLAGAKSRIDGKKVVCFGDSLFGMYRGEDSAPAFIAAETGATVYNVGFGGCRMSVHPTSGYAAFSMWALAKAIAENNWTTQDTQASSGSSYFPDQLALLKSIDFNTVDIAVIHYGTNDFAAGNAVQIDNASDPDDYNSLCGALRYSLDKLLGAYPKLRIYISLPVYRFWTDNGVTTYAETYLNKGGKTLPEFVEALRGVAAEYNLPVIDGYYGLGINKANAATFLSDGTHHNATGRERFGRFIGENLIAQQSSAKAGMDTAAINALIENAIGAAIGGSY